VTTAPVFVSYRRTDEPFATAVVATLLAEQVGEDRVFLDTLFLRQRGPFARRLLRALRSCRLVIAVVGTGWDNEKNGARLREPEDWVRRELRHAWKHGIPIVPVLVDRTDLPDFVGLLDLTAADRESGALRQQLRLRTADIWLQEPRLHRAASAALDLPPSPALPPRPRPELVERAALAMLRHVLPAPQRSMQNDQMIAHAVASALGDDEWLRFATAASTPGRPNGSAVVFLTRSDVGIIEINADLTPGDATRVPLSEVRDVARHDRCRLWRPVTDLHLSTGKGTVTVAGLFAGEADELLELAGLPKDEQPE
jgi:hypothetical protein